MRSCFFVVMWLGVCGFSAGAAAQNTTPSKTAKTKASAKKKAPTKPAPTAKAAAGTAAPTRAVSSVTDSQTALEVTGQSRNLSMMLVLKNRKDNIDFVKPRESYSTEIKDTNY